MRVLNQVTGSDTAGISVATVAAFRRHAPDWTVHSMVASQNYIGYPVDVPWSQRGLEELYDAADVIHTHNTLHNHRWYDNGQGKPTVLLHHGMHSLAEYRGIVEEGRRTCAVQVGSTLDLSVLEPEVEWLPAPVDLVRMREIRNENFRPSEKVRVGHAPTNRSLKGSDAFDDAMARLARHGVPVVKVLIEGRSWQECLAAKATCDLFFDQPVLGYGSNAVECWAMGIPVISGVKNPEVREGMLDRWGVLPFAEADTTTLARSLRALVSDADLREEYAKRGTAHVERWHDERVIVERLKAIYVSAPRTVPGGSEKRLTAETLAKLARHEARAAAMARRNARVRRLVRA